MPLYFFDTRHRDQAATDKEGSNLADFAEAKREAIELLPDLVAGNLPDCDNCEFVAMVRDEAGTELYRATLTFHGEKSG